MRISAVMTLVLLSGLAHAQSPPPVGIVDEPCTPAPPAPASADRFANLLIEPGKLDASGFAKQSQTPEAVAEAKARADRAAQDWPNLCKYRADNTALLASKTPTRVVFMGDSITELWVKGDPGLFTNGVVGPGIGGQTTPQMLVRFHADVVALRPKMVHILAGTNDVAGNTGPTSPQDYKNNVVAMVEIAKANGIQVILGSIPPSTLLFWKPEVAPAPRIAELNTWLREYAKQSGSAFVDYHSALAGSGGELKSEFANDGVHPNRNGYAVMRPLALRAIGQARQ